MASSWRGAAIARIAGWGLCVIAVGCALGAARLRSQGIAFLELGRAAQADGDEGQAILAYERAVLSYVPGGWWTREALAALAALARQREARGDAEGAAEAYQSIVSGLALIEHVARPYHDAADTAAQRLAACRAQLVSSATGEP